MRFSSATSFAALCALGALSLPQLAGASTPFGSNLIVNGNAEADLGSLSGGSIGSVTGFGITGDFTVIQYAAGGGYPAATDPGPADRGANFFGGGNVPFSKGEQVIDISDIGSAVDTGSATYDLSAYLGGYASQEDNAVLSISFLGAGSAALGSASVGPVTAEDRTDLTGLSFRQASGSLPTGTRSIVVDLSMTRVAGTANDGYADDLSLVLGGGTMAPAVPEPETWALMATGLAAVGIGKRRSQARR